MSWQTIRLADCAPQPWKNGGGLTRELLAWPSADDWRVRLSVADITADGPFSLFNGIQRWFAVLEGEGVCLTVNGTATELRPTCPAFGFAGSATTSCRLLGGPTRDFNLMLRGATGRLQRVQGRAHGELDFAVAENASKLIAIYSNNTRPTAHFDQDVCQLEPGTLAWRLVEPPTAGKVASWCVHADNALWMEITA